MNKEQRSYEIVQLIRERDQVQSRFQYLNQQIAAHYKELEEEEKKEVKKNKKQ